jgi:hypothetical protein
VSRHGRQHQLPRAGPVRQTGQDLIKSAGCYFFASNVRAAPFMQ